MCEQTGSLYTLYKEEKVAARKINSPPEGARLRLKTKIKNLK